MHNPSNSMNNQTVPNLKVSFRCFLDQTLQRKLEVEKENCSYLSDVHSNDKNPPIRKSAIRGSFYYLYKHDLD